MQFLPLVLIFVVFYFLLIRPQTKRAKEHRAMVAALEVGAEVVTNGGILGKVTELGDQYLTVEIANGVKSKCSATRLLRCCRKAPSRAPERSSSVCTRFLPGDIGSSASSSSAALLLALPNLFGDEVAIQLARDDRAAMDAAAQQRMSGHARGEEDRADDLVSRGRPADHALRACGRPVRARDAINEATAGEYVVALTSVPRTPPLLRKLGLKPMSLGLDLRGGVHFMYEVDIRRRRSIRRCSGWRRTFARGCARSAFRTPTSRVEGSMVRVTLRPGADVAAAARRFRPMIRASRFRTIRSENRPSSTIGYTPERLKQRQDLAIEQNITTLRNRVNELGVSEPIVARQGLDRIIVQLPGVQDPNQAMRVLGATATVEFRLVDEANNPYEAESTQARPDRLEAVLATTKAGRSC